MYRAHVWPSDRRRGEKMRKWSTICRGLAGEAKGTQVSSFPVLEPVVSVWGSGAADFARDDWWCRSIWVVC